MDVIKLARHGDDDAKAVLREAILELKSSGAALPVELEAYNMEVLHGAMGHAVSGPKRKDRLLRDVYICMTVAAVCDRFGLEPTGRARHRRSACDIVAETLQAAGIARGHKAVEKIWARYERAMPTVPGWALSD
jgi:hypothetical protein